MIHFLPGLERCLLVVGDGLARTLAGSGVGLITLATARKILLMPLSAIGTDFFQSLNVERDFTAQITFDDVLRDLGTSRRSARRRG
jgi:hypothetical protein